ncbi:Cytochrome c, mono-and diheme variants [Modicisalibacter muralis]|uniref:Cytochrome c, mono-and diheme variants n=1 Tax=Modicisalibacter muralis TaxID=119000 RepID=A0A1G9QBL0_9GAMM|nr:cytochrome c [Halomonas muralis]SDM08369.1 Cytochrome c, mono-and diheme variants [Halomonas muralis]
MRIAAAMGLVGLAFIPLAGQAADDSVIERGRYLTRAADCYVCHTAEGGAAYAGGRPLKTPFGTIYGTNITPDDETGIGLYSEEDFYRALHAGEARDGHQLYPAMPYTTYRLLTREDTNAIYHYLMSLEPVEHEAPDSELNFPFNQRWGLVFWNLLFLESGSFEPNPERSETWNRGRYLATALGHCGECHTPRGFMGQTQEDKYLGGSNLGRIWPPDITPQALAERGWTPDKLASYLSLGLSRLGAANGEMFPAVIHGTRYLTDADLDALISYLLTGVETPKTPSETIASADPKQAEGDPAPARLTYMNLCSGCHRSNGEGIPHTIVPLTSNSTLRLEDPHNLIAVLLDGIPLQDFPGHARMQAMPGYAQQLDDSQMAELVNYLRTTWGGQPGDVSVDDVAELRRSEARSAE